MTKKILTLLSVFCGAAIVGTTFAAWAVTDNADPFGIKITPEQGSVEPTKTVTLSWGENLVADIKDLKRGVPTLAGNIVLQAETSNSESYTGNFKMSFVDLTEVVGERSEKLIDHLTATIYEGEVDPEDLPETNLGVLPKVVESVKQFSVDYSMTVTATKVISVVVELDDVDVSVLDQIKDDEVKLEFDWNKANDDILTNRIYTNVDTTNDVYVYAWKDGGTEKERNAAFPGIKVLGDVNKNYAYDLSQTFDRVIFSQYNGTEKVVQSKELAITNDIRNYTPVFHWDGTATGGVWGVLTNKSMTKDYYLLGSINNWKVNNDDWGMTVEEGKADHYSIADVALDAGDLIKVRNRNGSEWLSCASVWTGCGFSIDSNKNLVITDAGTYTVNLWLNPSTTGNYISLTKAA